MNIDLIKLGQKIKFERVKRNLSQEKLAELADNEKFLKDLGLI